VFLRGAKSEHTLVLLDGVELNDPISPARGYDFANMAVNNIDRVEIIRGPQSTLYGSDAMGGVINIITKRGAGEPAGYLSVEGGSDATFRETAGVEGGAGRLGYSVGLTRLDTDGISSANELAGNLEQDGYANSSASARLDFQATEKLELGFILRFTDSETDLDNFGGAFGDDVNHFSESQQLVVRTQASLDLMEGRWAQQWAVSYTDHDREVDNPVDPAHPVDMSTSSFHGSSLKVDWQNSFELNGRNKLIFGVETEEEKGSSTFFSDGAFGPFSSIFEEERSRTNGYYIQDQLRAGESFHASIGVRMDDHDRFGTETTYRGTFSWKLSEAGTRLKGSYGTGFKAPSLFQLFSSFGDPDLAPEESTAWDVGVERPVAGGKAMLVLTGFMNEFENLIDFDSGSFSYRNITAAETSGLELEINAAVSKKLDLVAGVTWTKTEDLANGLELLRRPSSKLFAKLHYRVAEDLGISLDVAQIGERDDLDFATFPAARVTLDSYTLVNLAAGFRITPRVRLFGRLENLLDEQYEDVLGYGVQGFGGYAGVKFSM
jgi:vitamin B12 transporter